VRRTSATCWGCTRSCVRAWPKGTRARPVSLFPDLHTASGLAAPPRCSNNALLGRVPLVVTAARNDTGCCSTIPTCREISSPSASRTQSGATELATPPISLSSCSVPSRWRCNRRTGPVASPSRRTLLLRNSTSNTGQTTLLGRMRPDRRAGASAARDPAAGA